jgi:uncharacterized repeat protein (TIGR03803 family)
LYSFPTTNLGFFDPRAGLLAATDGYLYGSTLNEGSMDDGTLFRISTGGSFTSLFDFTGVGGAVPGSRPFATLTEDTNGCFYGLAEGNPTDGNVFSLCSAVYPPYRSVKIEGPIFVRPGRFTETTGLASVRP